MFSATAEFYDALYAFKDYPFETAKIRRLLEKERPGARTILDVACGTAEHARLLSADFEVDGIDLEPKFIEIAQAKIPRGKFTIADMRTFQLHKRYDVVQCLFSSIGYLLTSAEIVSALCRFKDHLAPGRVVLVEPWIDPANYTPGRPHMLIVDKPDLKICRMNVSRREGDVSVLDFHYMIADASGVRELHEAHSLALVPPGTMASYFQDAGLQYSFDPVGLFGRGLFVAREIDTMKINKRV